VVYSYDAVGSYEATKYATTGSGAQILQPLLDAQVSLRNCYDNESWTYLDSAR